jgi:NADH-quinone oxidoreductase subunit C
MRYDPERERVVYEPVSIEPRVLVPRVIREDHRYLVDSDNEAGEEAQDDA